jgi:hypothetical protein
MREVQISREIIGVAMVILTNLRAEEEWAGSEITGPGL